MVWLTLHIIQNFKQMGWSSSARAPLTWCRGTSIRGTTYNIKFLLALQVFTFAIFRRRLPLLNVALLGRYMSLVTYFLEMKW